MLYKIYQEIYIHVYVYNLKIMKLNIQTKFFVNLYINMDFLTKQQSIT